MFPIKKSAVAVALVLGSSASFATTGPSTTTAPYLVPTAPGVNVTSILTTGDSVGGYVMGGIPDGLGAYDNGNGTFTVLMNHEWSNSVGATHTHNPGATNGGAYVSKWVINKSDLSVVSGGDLIQNVATWNGTGYNAPTTGTSFIFNRFCSSDLPLTTAFYNSTTGNGYNGMIYMNGEESGAEGKAYGTVVATGTTYVLPHLGKFSWENSVASPYAQDKTIVMGTDDSSPGQVYMYVGTKNSTGATPVEKAGLTGGSLYGIQVPGLGATENRATAFTSGSFSLFNFGDVSTTTGASLQANSVANSVTEFLRPEDGAWDTQSNDKFYFVTTDRVNVAGGQVGRSRLWVLDFADIANPELGGNIGMLLDGTEGGQMFDNITVDAATGDILLQEDVGNNALIGNVWKYSPGTDSLTKILAHDSNRFLSGSPGFLTQDEESSGVIDVTDLFDASGASGRYYLMDTQAHFLTGNPETVEGGQLQLVHVAPVPVPAAVWLFGSALAGLGVIGRRKA